jgi:hypothetical protein
MRADKVDGDAVTFSPPHAAGYVNRHYEDLPMARHMTRGNGRSAKALRERKYRLRAKTTRFIPDGDSDFARMGRNFANYIAQHAERFGFSAEQVAKVAAAVDEFRDALHSTMVPSTCGPMATRIKNDCRAKAEEVIRAAARVLKATADESITSADRLNLNLAERPKRLKRRECPQIAPVLTFKGSTAPDSSGGGGGGRHILEYGNDFDLGSSAKPHGPARLELFVELVPPEWAVGASGEKKLPSQPGQLTGGMRWYLRSYTTSRFEVEFPVSSDGTPMLVLYWGRWADATGAYGPFSRTCVARVEGGPLPVLPMYIGARPATGGAERVSRRIEMKHVVFEQPRALPERIEGDEQREAVRMLAAG